MRFFTIRIKSGEFDQVDGGSVSFFDSTHIKVEDWDCIITAKGSIISTCKASYPDGIHTLKYYVSQNGYSRLTLKIPGQKAEVLRKGFILPKTKKLYDGYLTLSDEYIDTRIIFYRDISFQNFMDEHGIKHVKHKEPNNIFLLNKPINKEDGSIVRELLICDGKVYDNRAYETKGFFYLSVSDARWTVIIKDLVKDDIHRYFCTLYTLQKDLDTLEGVPFFK